MSEQKEKTGKFIRALLFIEVHFNTEWISY